MDIANKGSDETVMTRRKALTRLGGVALIAYAAPAMTTLSVAHAASGASASSDASSSSDTSGASSSSSASAASSSSGPSSSRGSSPASDACGDENLNDPNYVQCLVDNGIDISG